MPRANSNWTLAGTATYQYDLSSITVGGAVATLKGLRKAVAASAIKTVAGSYILNGIFQSGCDLGDERETYYRNIQQRPDMKEVHTVNFYFDLYGSRQYEKKLCGFTTGG